MVNYEVLVLGNLATNCYLLWESKTKEAVIVDPADSGVEIADEIERLQLKPRIILATHGHYDHLLGAIDLKLIYNIPWAINSDDFRLADRQFKKPKIKKIDIDLKTVRNLSLGENEIKVIKMKGHSEGSVGFWIKDYFLAGDSLEIPEEIPAGTWILPGHEEIYQLTSRVF